MLDGKPYPVKGIYIHGTNLAVNVANTQQVLEALRSLEFIVVVDILMNPTAKGFKDLLGVGHVHGEIGPMNIDALHGVGLPVRRRLPQCGVMGGRIECTFMAQQAGLAPIPRISFPAPGVM